MSLDGVCGDGGDTGGWGAVGVEADAACDAPGGGAVRDSLTIGTGLVVGAGCGAADAGSEADVGTPASDGGGDVGRDSMVAVVDDSCCLSGTFG